MDEVRLSASKLKTFQNCSWMYYCSYILRLPKSSNIGAKQGSCCHAVFECLLNPRHKDLYDIVMTESSTITNSKVIERYVRKFIKNNELPDESFDRIDSMIIVGLGVDFFCKGGTLFKPELEFNIKSDSPKYNITGLIDKTASYGEKFLRVSDFKSSKKRFEGDELKTNVQAMMYSLAAKKLWPHLTPIVDFIFLQFPKDPIQRLRFSNEDLEGFEIYLAEVSKQMKNFTLEDAKKNYASKQSLPKSGGGFCGPLICGWAGKKGFVTSPDQKKKDGSPSYYCSFRFPFDYYAVCDEEGKVLRTDMEENKLKFNKEKGEFLLKKRYLGCPGHKRDI